MTSDEPAPGTGGVVVLGMHRSGTSVAARLVSLLGPSLCRAEDLLRGHQGNVRGHWECAPLVTLNDGLLQQTASRWWCPPADGAIEALAGDAERRASARAAFERSHPRAPWVWKDPRTSLTLPFWRRVLQRPPAVVWVLRHPAEVVGSMLERDRIAPEFGEAVWERYLRLTARAVECLPVWLSTYDALVADPARWADRAARFLTANGVDARLPQDLVGLRGFVDPPRARRRDVRVSSSRLELWEAASAGGVGDLPEEDPEIAELMDDVREAFALHGREALPAGGGFRSRSGVRVLCPPAAQRAVVARRRVSVLLLPGSGPATRADAAQVRRRLPGDAEVLTVLTPGETPAADDPDWFVPVRIDRPLSLACRLDLAAERAQGDLLVVLAGPPVTPLPGWLPALRTAFADPDCAVAVPGLVPADGGEPAYGVSVSRLLSETTWVERPDGGEPFPVTAGTVAAMATTRTAWQLAGGFDRGMQAIGSEDVDYCLRLWRSGWRCLAVPGAQLQVRFALLPAGPLDVLADTLRLGVVHLPGDLLEQQLADLRELPGFASALARVTASDAGRRRRVVDARSWYGLGELAAAGLPEEVR